MPGSGFAGIALHFIAQLSGALAAAGSSNAAAQSKPASAGIACP
jgi:hypothetical protein